MKEKKKKRRIVYGNFMEKMIGTIESPRISPFFEIPKKESHWNFRKHV